MCAEGTVLSRSYPAVEAVQEESACAAQQAAKAAAKTGADSGSMLRLGQVERSQLLSRYSDLKVLAQRLTLGSTYQHPSYPPILENPIRDKLRNNHILAYTFPLMHIKIFSGLFWSGVLACSYREHQSFMLGRKIRVMG